MRVLHLLSSNALSGAERIAILISRSLSDRYEFAYCSPDGPIADVLSEAGVRFYAVAAMTRKCASTVARMYRPDVMHAHDYRASVNAAMVPSRARVIAHLHNNYPEARRIALKTVALALALPRFCKVITVSKAVVDEFVFSRSLRRKTAVIPNAVDAEEIVGLANAHMCEPIDLIFVGRLSYQKDPVAFIEVVAAVKERIGDIRAVIIGRGELEERCRRRIEELNLQNNVRLTGFVSNPYSYMLSAKGLVMPSRYEGFGLVALEAMILGTPVLCSPVGGLQELIRGGGGFLCESSQEFADRATELLTNERLRSRLSREGATRGRTFSDITRFLGSITQIYDAIH